MVCPRCTGKGTIRDTKSLALAILRLLQEEAAKDRTGEVRAVVPVEVAAFLLNEKRSAVNDIENSSGVRVLIIPNPHMETPHFDVIRLRDDEVEETTTLSYEVAIEAPDPIAVRDEVSAVPAAPQPLVRGVTPQGPAPVAAEPEETIQAQEPVTTATKPAAEAPQKAGMLSRMWGALFAPAITEEPKAAEESEAVAPASEENPELKENSNRQRRSRGGRNRTRSRRPESDSSIDDASDAEQAISEPEQADSGDSDSDADDRPKRNRRRRGRRGGQKRQQTEGSEVATQEDESASEDDDNAESNDQSVQAANTEDTSESARHRPSDKRSEGRRRRQRGPKLVTPEDNASADVAAVKNEAGETEALAEAPANAVAESTSQALGSVTDQIDLLGEAANGVSETEEPSEVAPTEDAQSTAEIAEPASPEPTPQPVEAASETQTIADATAELKSEEIPAEATQSTQEIDRSGVTPAGRAVNDPRVDPRPIGEVDVETLRQALFLEQEAPPVSIVSRDIPRASNDPRGPKAGLSFTAPKGSSEAPSEDDSLPDVQAN